MSSHKPRIYTYKITFNEVPYYYYGVHKEKYFDEEYWGTPITHKWVWDFYTPKKQILQLFDFTDEGWLKALEVERRIIKKFYISDKWCLNENCGGNFSLDIRRKNGYKVYNEGKGIHSRTKEEMQEQGRKNAEKLRENKRGIFGMSVEEKMEAGRKSARMSRENNTGFFSLTKEQRIENAKKGVEIQKELGLGIFSLTKDERQKNGSKGGIKTFEEKLGIHSFSTEKRRKIGRKSCSQKWICLITGYVANPGNLTKYQRAKGIDVKMRKKLNN